MWTTAKISHFLFTNRHNPFLKGKAAHVTPWLRIFKGFLIAHMVTSKFPHMTLKLDHDLFLYSLAS